MRINRCARVRFWVKTPAAIPFKCRAAGDQICPFIHGLSNKAQCIVALAQSAKGSNLGRHVIRSADNNRFGFFLQTPEEFVLDRALHQQPRPGHATLTSGCKNARNLRVYRAFDIGVFENIERGFSAKFQRGRAQVFGRIANDMARGFRTACKGHVIHQWMARQRCAHIRTAGDDVQDTFRKPGLIKDPGKFQNRGRGVFGRFKDNGTPRRQSGSDFHRR